MKTTEIIQVILMAALFLLAVGIMINNHIKEKKFLKQREQNLTKAPQNIAPPPQYYNPYQFSYERQYLMTMNEKAQFRTIKNWADQRGLIVFTKVRLLDLVKPRNNQQNYQSLFWKVQAKHVDFIICDHNINVKCIIEINDRSHFDPDRINRDIFVRDVLQACGYNVIQTFAITASQLNNACGYPDGQQ